MGELLHRMIIKRASERTAGCSRRLREATVKLYAAVNPKRGSADGATSVAAYSHAKISIIVCNIIVYK